MSRTLTCVALLAAISLSVACGDAGGSGGGGGGGGNNNTGGGNNIGGGEMSQTAIELADTSLSKARFSPDGSRLVVNHQFDDPDDEADGDNDVATMELDGTDLQFVVEGVSYLTAPTWSADGASLIVNDGELYRINTDGTGRESLASAFASTAPDLSPDEMRLVYGVNGSDMELKTLTDDQPAASLDEAGYTPRFSPDGTQIAYATSSAIKVMGAQSLEAREVVTGELSYLSTVAWFPDGQHLAITSERGVEIVDLESDTRTTLIDQFAAKDVDVSADGSKLVYGVNGQTKLHMIEWQ